MKEGFSFPSVCSPFSKRSPDCQIAFSGHKRLLFISRNTPDKASLKFFPKQKTPVPGFKINIYISKKESWQGEVTCTPLKSQKSPDSEQSFNSLMPSRPTGGKQGSVTERSQGFVKGQVYWVDRVLRENQQGNTPVKRKTSRLFREL